MPEADWSPTTAAVPPSRARLAVQRLRLSQFRNYSSLRLETDARHVVLAGPNGAGKTNLLEALSFLSPGRGLRRARLREPCRNGGDVAWAVAAHCQGPVANAAGAAVAFDVGTGLDPAGNGSERRVSRIDGETLPASTLARHLGVQWLTPQMDRLFLEGAGARRRFLDRLVLGFDGDHGRRVAAYERSMRERTRLLKEGVADPAWLQALEAGMAADGVAVAAARRDAVSRLTAALEDNAGPFPGAVLAADGLLEAQLDASPAVEVEAAFQAGLAANRGRDAAAGTAVDGPHRSDLRVRHAAKDMPAEQCSTGEQKALLIAIQLANVRLETLRRGQAPLLLLDEVAAHLDEDRREALFAELAGLEAQTWLTGTEAALFASLRGQAQFFAVRDGQLAQEDR